jgi:hypothetical protein
VRWPLALALLLLTTLLLAAALVGRAGGADPVDHRAAPAPGGSAALTGGMGTTRLPNRPPFRVETTPPIGLKPGLPLGGQRIFAGHRFLVAYYGTAQTGAMGVLGRTDPATMQRRLMRAARPFRQPGEVIQPVYELIATIADGSPGPDHDFSHDIPASYVREYLDVAHRHHALLLLDLQTGRSDFPTVARRWAWALKDPSVGLALDPEWRMGPRQVPARVVGHVQADEVNRTSLWLSRLVRRESLPQKLFVLHQFRVSMLPDIDWIVSRPGLAMVQHTDGFGTRGQKLATYHAVARPAQFTQGFKLFYHWDVKRFTPQQVRRLMPRVSFVSYQ